MKTKNRKTISTIKVSTVQLKVVASLIFFLTFNNINCLLAEYSGKGLYLRKVNFSRRV